MANETVSGSSERLVSETSKNAAGMPESMELWRINGLKAVTAVSMPQDVVSNAISVNGKCLSKWQTGACGRIREAGMASASGFFKTYPAASVSADLTQTANETGFKCSPGCSFLEELLERPANCVPPSRYSFKQPVPIPPKNAVFCR